MSITIPEKCIRSRADCEPLALIESDSGKSFICCGLNDGTSREIEQDRFTFCFKNEKIDEMTHCDDQDMKDQISVLAQALSVEQHMRQSGVDDD